MRISQLKRGKKWVARLEYQGAIYQGEGKTRASALKTAFDLFSVCNGYTI